MSNKKDTDTELEITGGTVTNGHMLGVLLTGGLGVVVPPTRRYIAENPETGEKHKVLAQDRDEAKRKAREGKFER